MSGEKGVCRHGAFVLDEGCTYCIGMLEEAAAKAPTIKVELAREVSDRIDTLPTQYDAYFNATCAPDKRTDVDDSVGDTQSTSTADSLQMWCDALDGAWSDHTVKLSKVNLQSMYDQLSSAITLEWNQAHAEMYSTRPPLVFKSSKPFESEDESVWEEDESAWPDWIDG